MGQTPDAIRRILDSGGAAKYAGAAGDALSEFSKASSSAMTDARSRLKAANTDKLSAPAKLTATKKNLGQLVQQYMDEGMSYPVAMDMAKNTLDKINQGDIPDVAKDQIDKAVEGRWDKAESMIKKMRPSGADGSAFDKRLAKIGKIDDYKERVDEARKLVADTGKRGMGQMDDPNKVHVEFTGMAAKFFRQKPSDFRDNAKAGGVPSLDTLTSPQAASSAADAWMDSVRNGNG
jgi:inorganic pyrophosphatase